MKYFKNSELVRLYNVSDKAIRNWIEATRQGRLSLELFEQEGRAYIADTIHNSATLEVLVQRGKKYRNRRNHVKVQPTKDFYKLLSERQIIEVINNLDKHSEFPQQYRYLGEGAHYWNSYLNKLQAAGRGNLLTNTQELIDLDLAYIDSITSSFAHVNIVDIGVGNGLSAKNLLLHFKALGKMGRYIGIDISPDLLDITEQNLKAWVGDGLRVEKYVRDLNYEQFGDVVDLGSHGTDPSGTINIMLFLGGIIGNFRRDDQALATIRESMAKNDILLTSIKLDTPNTRRFFDFNIASDKSPLSLRNKLPLDYLSIHESYYEVEQFFDERENSRFIQVRLKIDISVEFEINNHIRTVELHKGDALLIFRSREYSDRALLELYEKNDFLHLRSTLSHNRECILLTSKAKRQVNSIPTYNRSV